MEVTATARVTARQAQQQRNGARNQKAVARSRWYRCSTPERDGVL
jgi:hypothetical protein